MTTASTTTSVEGRKVCVVKESLESEGEVVENRGVDAFLLSRPVGVYTVCRTLFKTHIVGLHDHVSRLVTGMKGKGLWVEGEHSEADVERSFREHLSSALRCALSRVPTKEGEEYRLTCLLATSQGTPRLGFPIMVEVLPVIAGRRVAVEAWPTLHRINPLVKDSEWVSRRLVLKERIGSQPGVNEVVLAEQEAGVGLVLLEGLSSNFFVVREGPSSKLEVVTAPLGRVLSGTVRTMMVDSCKELGVPFVEECPRVEDGVSGRWSGSFITSTTRLLLEVDEVRVFSTAKDTDQPTVVRFNPPQHCRDLLSKLSLAVASRIKEVSVPIL